MKIKAISRFKHLLILFLSFMFLISCSKKPITFEPLPDWQQVNEGDELRINWVAINADYVKVEGIEGIFKSRDYFSVKPTGFTKYNIIAYSNGDSLIRTIRVTLNPKSNSKIITGPESFSKKTLDQSIVESDFLSGYLEKSISNGPTKLKIIRTVYPQPADNNYKVRFLLTDQFGNFINGFSSDPNKSDKNSWEYISSVDSKEETYSINSINESLFGPNQYVDIGFLFENSLLSQHNKNIIPAMKECLSYLTSDDNVLLSLFNHDYKQLIQLSSVFKAGFEIDRIKMPKNEGLVALYKSAYTTLENMSLSSSPNKALVIVTSYSDNASLLYDASDVETLAKKLNIPVYIVAVGNSASTYQLKYLCQSTGGKFYQIDSENPQMLSDALREIALSNKIYYEIAINGDQINKGNKAKLTVKYADGNKLMLDACYFINKTQKQHIAYQSLATFEKDQTDFNPIYKEHLGLLAGILKENPTEQIEICGNSSSDDTDKDQKELSLSRAESVRDYLVEYGAFPAQVKTKGIGVQKPIFYFENTPSQSEINRRVDIRWLDARDMPYEILTGKSYSEEDADNSVNSWINNGYKAYYQRVTEKDNIYYVTHLWGFSTFEKATDTAKELSRKYKKNFYVE